MSLEAWQSTQLTPPIAKAPRPEGAMILFPFARSPVAGQGTCCVSLIVFASALPARRARAPARAMNGNRGIEASLSAAEWL
jgi:hypothetical protein